MSQIISWFGSKSKFANRIVNTFPKHETFIDVFGGSGIIILSKLKSKIEVYNDIDSRLVNLYKVLQEKTSRELFLEKIHYVPHSREFYNECKRRLINDNLSNIDEAVCFFVICRQSYAGIADYSSGWSYSKTPKSASTNKFQKGIRSIDAFVHRFRYVQIENQSFENILTKYDTAKSLFYLDPPYVLSTRSSGRYKHEMSDDDHKNMVNLLLKTNGMAIVSGYDNDIYNKLELNGWRKESFTTRANASKIKKQNNTSSLRQECLWFSPNCQANCSSISKTTNQTLTNRQKAAISVARQRAERTEVNIKQAIREIRLSKKKVTKTAVAKMIGMSRVHITRKYSYLFK